MTHKVIAVDNLNRDYQPQRQLTLAVDLNSASKIANLLNEICGSYVHHRCVPAEQELNLESMNDLVGEDMPYTEWLNYTGARALPEHVAKYWYNTTVLKQPH